jgi:putative ABC transport system permease protein
MLGALAIAFATEVVTFVGTYQSAKRADSHAAFGSDLRLTPEPSDVPPAPPRLGPHVAATTPIRHVGVRAGTDRKTVMTVDPATYDAATSVSPRILEGGGLADLVKQPHGVLVAKEIAADYEVHPGDPLPLTLVPDDPETKQNVTFKVVGVYRSFPPDAPPSEMVMTTANFPPSLLPPPDFYLARTIAGHPAPAVAGELTRAGVTHTYGIATTADAARSGQRTLAALNLTGLSRIESLGAVLIAAVGVAVLGAFVVLERRREFAILRAIGIDTRRLLVPPAQEGLIAVLASLVLGLVIGVVLGGLAVRVLTLFFQLPPPLLSVPIGPIAAFVVLVAAFSALALSGALAAVARIRVASVLREP